METRDPFMMFYRIWALLVKLLLLCF